MKTSSSWFFALAVVTAWLGSSAPLAYAGLNPHDFYCRNVPVQPPAFFKTHAPSCVGAKGNAAQTSVCVENAYCTYVDDATKKMEIAAADGKKKKFKDLSPAERTKYLVDNVAPSDWLPSTLTCVKTSPAGSTECPSVDHCKGDVNYGWYPATYSQDETAAYMITPAQSSGAFQNDGDGDGKAAEPAK